MNCKFVMSMIEYKQNNRKYGTAQPQPHLWIMWIMAQPIGIASGLTAELTRFVKGSIQDI